MSKKKKQTDQHFQLWVNALFNHPEPKTKRQRQRLFDTLSEVSSLFPNVKISYLTRLFTNATSLLGSYSNAQIASGLYAINNTFEYMTKIMDTNISWESRQECLDSIYTLFANFFVKRCDKRIAYASTTQQQYNALNGVCYMWWDIFPTHGQPQYGHALKLDRAILALMAKQLTIPHVACQESALHGLGHWHISYPDEVNTIIKKFLADNEYMNPKLKEYALFASNGRVQ